MRSFFLFFTLMIFFLTSCKKDDESKTSINVIIGDYSNMITKSYDTIIVGHYPMPVSINIDVNNDSLPDFQLISDVWGSPGLGKHPRSRIACLNSNTYLLGYLQIDTSFLNRTQIIHEITNDTTVIYEYDNYTCHRISNKDTILNIKYDVFKVSAKSKNDVIEKDNFFKSDTITLIDDMLYYPPYTSGYESDIIIYRYCRVYNDCNTFPLDEIKYIGFKVIKNDKEKLGWIKLSIIENNKIIIMESAIEK